MFFAPATSIRLHSLAILVVLLFAIYKAVAVFVEGKATLGEYALVAIVALLAIWLFFRRDTYLPFLGEAVLPPIALMSERVPEGADRELTFAVPGAAESSRVIYWAAAPAAGGAPAPDPWTAYETYQNTGIAVVRDGFVSVKFQCPQEYKVGKYRRPLRKHIHYRVCCPISGMLGRVETKYVDC